MTDSPALLINLSGNGFCFLVSPEEAASWRKIGQWTRPFSRDECAAELRRIEAAKSAGVWECVLEKHVTGFGPAARVRRGWRWQAVGCRGQGSIDWIDDAPGVPYDQVYDLPPRPRPTTAAERASREGRAL